MIQPCYRCIARTTCAHYKDITSFVKYGAGNALISLPVSLVRMKCEDYDRLYSRGARVSVKLSEYWINDEDGYPEGEYTGTIMAKLVTGKILVWIDDDQYTARERVRVGSHRISFLPEPPVETCVCGTPIGKPKTDKWSCDECDKRSLKP